MNKPRDEFAATVDAAAQLQSVTRRLPDDLARDLDLLAF